MTDDKIALRALLEKGSDTTFLREMIGFAAERLMALETETLCGAAPASAVRRELTSAMDIATGTGRRAPARSSCASPNFAMAVISRASWSRAVWPRRR